MSAQPLSEGDVGVRVGHSEWGAVDFKRDVTTVLGGRGERRGKNILRCSLRYHNVVIGGVVRMGVELFRVGVDNDLIVS